MPAQPLPPRVEIVDDKVLLVVEGKAPRLVGTLRAIEDGRVLVIPDRINLRGAVTALRANPEEARAYLEPLALAAAAIPAKAEAAAEPDLFSQS